MSNDIVPVIIVQMTGSPGQVFEHMDEALEEVRQLAQAMIDGEAMPVPIHVRTGTMSRKVLDSLGAENAALREIAQAVANLPIQDTWHGNTIELYDCEYFHVFDEDAHALVDRARALLGGASRA